MKINCQSHKVVEYVHVLSILLYSILYSILKKNNFEKHQKYFTFKHQNAFAFVTAKVLHNQLIRSIYQMIFKTFYWLINNIINIVLICNIIIRFIPQETVANNVVPYHLEGPKAWAAFHLLKTTDPVIARPLSGSILISCASFKLRHFSLHILLVLHNAHLTFSVFSFDCRRGPITYLSKAVSMGVLLL